MNLFRRDSARPSARVIGRALSLSLLAPTTLLAQLVEPPDLEGRWEGILDAGPQGEITMAFEISVDEEGALGATLDVPTQGVTGIPTGETTLAGDTLTVTVPAISGRFRGVLTDETTLDGRWAQGPADLPLVLRRVESATELERPQHPEPPFPYEVEEVTYRNPDADIVLAGTLTRPPGDGPFPAVLLISGSGAQDRDETIFGHKPFLVLADHLTREGVAVLRVDDRGVGGSGGDFTDVTSRDFASDVRSGVAWLEGRPDIDAVGLVGHSEGGVIAPMVAADDPRVDFIVMLAGTGVPGSELLPEQTERMSRAGGLPEEVVSWNRDVVEDAIAVVLGVPAEERLDSLRAVFSAAVEALPPEQRALVGVPEDGVEAFADRQAQALASPWMAFFFRHDPRDDLGRVRVPVLALNGSLDMQVPADQNLPEIEEALREGGNDRSTVRELPGLNHLFQTAESGAGAEYGAITETFAPEALRLISDWILEVTGG